MECVVIICIVCYTVFVSGHSINVSENCDTEYQLTDTNGEAIYNVSSTIQDCSSMEFNFMRRRKRFQKYTNSFSLHIEKEGDERGISLQWNHSACRRDYFIGVTATFAPNYILHEHSQQCLRVIVRAVESNVYIPKLEQLHFDCFRLPSDIIGVLHVQGSHGDVYKNGCFSKRTELFKDFSIGCTFVQTRVILGGECLDLILQHVSKDISLHMSRIDMRGPGDWTHTFKLSTHHFVDQLDHYLTIPVDQKGKYTIEVLLVCNANGEIGRRNFTFEKMIHDPLLCSSVIKRSLAVTRLASPTPTSDYKNLDIILVTLCCIIGAAIGVAVVVFVHCVYTKRRRTPDRRDQTDEPLARTAEVT